MFNAKVPNEDELAALSNAIYGDCENDDDLNAELAALIGDDSATTPPRSTPSKLPAQARPVVPKVVEPPAVPRRPAPQAPARPAPQAPPRRRPRSPAGGAHASRSKQNRPRSPSPASRSHASKPKQTAADVMNSLQQLKIDPSLLSDNFEEEIKVSDDETDEAGLLAELDDVTSDRSRKIPTPQPVSVGGGSEESALVRTLRDRLGMYQQAESDAKNSGDTSRARRLGRGINTLKSQIGTIGRGGSVKDADIPPPVATKVKKHIASSVEDGGSKPEPSVQPVVEQTMVVDRAPPPQVIDRQTTVSVQPTTIGGGSAVQVLPAVPPKPKQKAPLTPVEHPVPPSPKTPEGQNPGGATSAGATGPPAQATAAPSKPLEDPTPQQPKTAEQLFHAPPQPRTPMEALLQRRDKYKSAAEHAKEEGNGSKSRRMGRIQKQYEDAIKSMKAGRVVDLGSLPVPPGFPPIPGIEDQEPAAPGEPTSPAQPTHGAGHDDTPPAAVKPSPPKKPKTSPGGGAAYKQQLMFLIGRQAELKRAAITAKKAGNIALAKEYLLKMKGIEPMVDAAKGGLPVDIRNVPPAPKELSQEVAQPVTYKRQLGERKSLTVVGEQTREETYATLEKDLIRQYQTCKRNSEFFTKLGDVSKANLYDRLKDAQGKILISLRNGWKHGDPAPRFHYELKRMPSLQCCPDLDMTQMELQVIRGIQIRPPEGYEPKHMAVFVRVLVPTSDRETMSEEKTETVKGTNTPSFKFSTKTALDRKSRAMMRVIERKGIRYEVYQKGAFLRSDKLLGTAELKLAGLQSDCELHQSLDLMDGRRPCGGKLEVKIRIREPLAGGGVAVKEDNWAVVDEFLVAKSTGRKSMV